ncbi:universal stress protein [Peribacillus glennii]|uniref:Universal stress protein n=1 Tax=Peribacillus glennii TaxID=2303991 RepID=A0A372L970_9BACI|nr:universal stress protein [Peribacillus glennii]RFU62047.1 universal stress protein [Peribacillus glennii]
MFRKILLAADGSHHALRAAEKAAEMATMNEAGITVLYVVDSSTSKTDILLEGDRGAVNDRRRQRLAPIENLLNEKDVTHQVKILKGDPGPTIVEYVNQNGYDLVVIGSRGLNSLQEMVLGSVSHKVAKRVQCPVMIVK